MLVPGTITITLDPPSISFDSTTAAGSHRCHCNCTPDEVRQILMALGSDMEHRWPVRECFVHSTGQFSAELLSRFGVLPPEAIPGKVSKFRARRQTSAFTA